MDIHREIRKWANRKIRKVAKEHGLPTGVTFEWSRPTLAAENCGVATNSVQQPHAVGTSPYNHKEDIGALQ